MQAFLNRILDHVAAVSGMQRESIDVVWDGVEFNTGVQAPPDWTGLARLDGTILVELKDISPEFDLGSVIAELLSHPPSREPAEDARPYQVVFVGRARLRALESTRDTDKPGVKLRLAAEGQILRRETQASAPKHAFMGHAPQIGVKHVEHYVELGGSGDGVD